jgi:hypothetical protein
VRRTAPARQSILEVRGGHLPHYTVAFRPFGPDGVAITLNYLTRTDLREA